MYELLACCCRQTILPENQQGKNRNYPFHIGHRIFSVEGFFRQKQMKTVRLITCDSSFQARLILGALENEGIAGILHNENSSNILKGYINNIGVDIFVYEDEYEKALQEFPHAVWSTYGMTETLSHIALRRLNGSDHSDWYTPFDNVSLRL
jgi:acyl-CoA synthetase (AMP-forming)/AMP-acid ligase II